MPTFRQNRHQGKSETTAKKNAAIYSHALLRIHVNGGQRSARIALPSLALSGSIMETSHHSSLHIGQMMGLKVEIPVCMHGLHVNKDIQAAILSSLE